MELKKIIIGLVENFWSYSRKFCKPTMYHNSSPYYMDILKSSSLAPSSEAMKRALYSSTNIFSHNSFLQPLDKYFPTTTRLGHIFFSLSTLSRATTLFPTPTRPPALLSPSPGEAPAPRSALWPSAASLWGV